MAWIQVCFRAFDIPYSRCPRLMISFMYIQLAQLHNRSVCANLGHVIRQQQSGTAAYLQEQRGLHGLLRVRGLPCHIIQGD